MSYELQLNNLLKKHSNVLTDLSRAELIKGAIENREVFTGANGALAVVNPVKSTGRSPKDTYIVKRDEITNKIDWDSPTNNAIDPEVFAHLFGDAVNLLKSKDKLYVTNRAIGADADYSLPVTTITDRALTALFTDNMFREVPKDIKKSVFNEKPFHLVALPYDKLETEKYIGNLRITETGECADLIVVMDFARRIGIVIGSAYLGCVKKLMFTVMNYLLPGAGVLPLHTSANEGKNGDIALFLGLSGTGKTTLSADPSRSLLGDDEHGWSNNGIANFENGCYAKLIDLDAEKEPEIYNAIMHHSEPEKHGAIVENVMVYPGGEFDLCDDRLTENSRGSYPLTFLSKTKKSSIGGHPDTIFFLTADANGVLPPVAMLTENQAMLWFLMGYTSKLAGTETGVKEPVSTFSRFFGEPFMPRNPSVYASMLGKKIKEHDTKVFLINTGWCGGPYGKWPRIDLKITRSIVNTLLTSNLSNIEFEEDPIFHIMTPKAFPGVPLDVLRPRKAWKYIEEYNERANKLAKEFSDHFDKVYGNKNIDEDIIACCPGK